MRRFNLVREEDESGVSGTGVVAQGVMFWDKSCAMCWMTDVRSICVYNSVADLEAIHGRGGKTKVVWIDEKETGNGSGN